MLKIHKLNLVPTCDLFTFCFVSTYSNVRVQISYWRDTIGTTDKTREFVEFVIIIVGLTKCAVKGIKRNSKIDFLKEDGDLQYFNILSPNNVIFRVPYLRTKNGTLIYLESPLCLSLLIFSEFIGRNKLKFSAYCI